MKHSIMISTVLLMPMLASAMSFEELSSLAYTHSLHKVEGDGKRQSLMYEKEAMSAYDPITLEGSARKIRADDPAGDGMEYGVMVGFTAKNPRVREAQNAQFDAALQTLEGTSILKKGQIDIELKQEYLLSQLAKDALDVTVQKKVLSEEAYAIAVKKHQAGRISQMELVRFETERDVAEKEYRERERVIRVHQDALREQTLLEDNVITVDDLAFGYIDGSESQQRIENSPILKNYLLAQEELERSIETLRRSTVESVNVGVGMTQEPTQNSFDVRLIVPLAIGNKNEKRIAALMAQRSALVHQKELSEQKMRLSIKQSLERLSQLQRSVELALAVEKRHESLYQMAKKGFEGGVVSLFEYLETKNRFYSARIETIGIKQSYVEETAKMEEKLGGIWK